MKMFGEFIRDARRGKGFKLDYVALKCGTHKGYVSGIENGKVNPPSAKFVKRLARLLGLDTRMLLVLAWAEKAPKEIRRAAIAHVDAIAADCFLWRI